MRYIRTAACFLLLVPAAAALAQRETNHAALSAIAARSRARAEAKNNEAKAIAKRLGLPVLKAERNGRILELIEFRRGKPVYLATDNVNAATSTRANRVHPGGAAGLSLTGLGVVLGIWDGGTVRTTHQEYSGRVTVRDGEARSGDHASHVAGTMIATGVNASAKGMSFQATLDSYGWNSDESEMALAGSSGLRLSNHSYGYITGWYNNGISWYWYGDLAVSSVEDPGFGFYDSTAQGWDNVAYNAPYYLICKSAGNDRNEGPATQPVNHFVWDNATSQWVSSSAVRNRDGNGTGYDTVTYNGTAKNIMTVGAVNDVLNYTGPSSVTMSSFSGWGPTDDGRIKPDIVGNGVGLFSSVGSSDTGYASFSGTSMSSPNVTGSLGLLVHHYRNTHAGADMRAATLKALAIHTADECGSNPGPDYAFGWGLLNVERAAQTITQDLSRPETVTEEILNVFGTGTFAVASDGTQPLRVTICWTDPAGTPPAWSLNPATSVLVNDLDLRVIGPSGTATPWVLNPASPGSAATTGDNFRDNVEQVYIAAPAAGSYTIQVTHKGGSLAPSGQQAYSIIITGQGDAPVPAELSDMTLSAASVGGGNSVTGTVFMTNSSGGTVTLSSNSPVATVPAEVVVPAGSTSATFTVSTSAVAATTTATITATKGANSRSRDLQVQAAQLTGLSVSPSAVTGGSGSTGTVTVSGNVPAGGITIALSDDSANVGTPASVVVAQGQTSASFAITTNPVSASETAIITASFEANTRTASLNAQPQLSLAGLSISPSSVPEGHNSTGTVTLSGPAPPGGAVVTISELGGTSSLVLPASVTVPAGSSSASFTIGTKNIGSTAVVRTVGASYNGSTSQANITINPIFASALSVSPSTVKGGFSSTGTVTLTSPAGVGGTVVNLSDNSPYASVPATVTVGAGASSASFTITTSRPPRRQTVTITATRNGTSRTALLTVTK